MVVSNQWCVLLDRRKGEKKKVVWVFGAWKCEYKLKGPICRISEYVSGNFQYHLQYCSNLS